MLKLAKAATILVVGASVIGVASITNTAQASADPTHAGGTSYNQQSQPTDHGNHYGNSDNDYRSTQPSPQTTYTPQYSSYHPSSSQPSTQHPSDDTAAYSAQHVATTDNGSSDNHSQPVTHDTYQASQNQPQVDENQKWGKTKDDNGKGDDKNKNVKPPVNDTDKSKCPKQNKPEPKKTPCPTKDKDTQSYRDNHHDHCPTPAKDDDHKTQQPEHKPHCTKPVPNPCPKHQDNDDHDHKKCPTPTHSQGGKGGGPASTPPTTPTTPATPTPVYMAPAAAVTAASAATTQHELTNTGVDIAVTSILAALVLSSAVVVYTRRSAVKE